MSKDSVQSHRINRYPIFDTAGKGDALVMTDMWWMLLAALVGCGAADFLRARSWWVRLVASLVGGFLVWLLSAYVF